MTTVAIPTFTAGTLVRVRSTFATRKLTDWELGQANDNAIMPAGIALDPPSVTATVQRPDGSTYTTAVTRVTAGIWDADVDTTGYKGPWSVHVASPAGQPSQAAGEAVFTTVSKQL